MKNEESRTAPIVILNSSFFILHSSLLSRRVLLSSAIATAALGAFPASMLCPVQPGLRSGATAFAFGALLFIEAAPQRIHQIDDAVRFGRLGHFDLLPCEL